MFGWMLGLLGLLYIGHGLPTFTDIAQLDLSGTITVGGLPVLLVAYPVYMVACIMLAVDSLRRPAKSERFMGDIARRRAYPWLLAASLILLALLGGTMTWKSPTTAGTSVEIALPVQALTPAPETSESG